MYSMWKLFVTTIECWAKNHRLHLHISLQYFVLFTKHSCTQHTVLLQLKNFSNIGIHFWCVAVSKVGTLHHSGFIEIFMLFLRRIYSHYTQNMKNEFLHSTCCKNHVFVSNVKYETKKIHSNAWVKMSKNLSQSIFQWNIRKSEILIQNSQMSEFYSPTNFG